MASTTTSIRLSEAERLLLQQLAQKLGISRTAVMRLAIRRLAALELLK